MSQGTTNIPVVNLVVKRDGKILFLKRGNTGWADGMYGLPSGHVEQDENFRSAGVRELEEETGLKVTADQLHHLLTFHQWDERGDIRVGVYFEVSDWTGEPVNAEPDKHSDLAWFDENAFPDSIIPTTRAKLDLIKIGERYVEFGWDKPINLH